jgi:ribokinase
MGCVGVCGSVNMDVFGYVDHAPGPGESVFGHRLAYAPGGKGANQAVAASRLGAAVRFVGACGTDPFGDTVVDALATDGIDLSSLRRVDDPTGVALIVVSDDGENRIVALSGANARAEGPVADPAVGVWLTEAEVPVDAIAATLAAARSTGAVAIVNPSPAGVVPAELVQRFDIAVVNEIELAALGDRRPATVILTLGARGARILPEGRAFAAFPAQVVDTTGAGDALVGGLAVGLADGASLEQALQLGLATASLCVERHGCQPAMPLRVEVERRLESVR